MFIDSTHGAPGVCREQAMYTDRAHLASVSTTTRTDGSMIGGLVVVYRQSAPLGSLASSAEERRAAGCAGSLLSRTAMFVGPEVADASAAARPRVSTMVVPCGRKASATPTAEDNSPPGLPLMCVCVCVCVYVCMHVRIHARTHPHTQSRTTELRRFLGTH
jgi:hypothetical protein